MAVLLSIFEQALLLGSLALFTAYVLWYTTHGTNSKELALRLMALFAGALVVICLQVAGISFATFSVSALANPHHVNVGARIAGIVFPGLAGVAIGWYLTRSQRRDEDVAMRIMAFTAMLAATQFAAIYVVAMSRRGLELGATALPNLSFVIGIFIYVILTYDTSARPALRRLRSRSSSNLAGAATPSQANLFHLANDALYGRTATPRPPSVAVNPADGNLPDAETGKPGASLE
jgi:hypothetical protein